MSKLLHILTGLPTALLLAGCTTTDPHAALPAVQDRLASHAGAAVTWPLTDPARAEADAAVRELLGTDLTVDTAVRIALLNNRGLRATLEELGLSQADLAAAARLPNPGLSTGVRWPHNAPRGPNVDLTLSAPLLELLLLPLRKTVAEDRLVATQARVAHEVLELIADAKSSAYGVLAAQDIRRRLEVIARVNEAAADVARRQFAAGNIPELEQAETQILAKETQVALARADADIVVARERLNHVLALTGAQTHWKMPGGLPPLPSSDLLPEDPEATALRQRPDLAAARMQVKIAEQALALKRRTRLLPGSVDLGVNTERDSDGSRISGPEIAFELPLFDQGQPELARLTANVRLARSQEEALAAAVGSEVRAARAALLAARRNVEFHEQTLLPRRQAILQETLLHYNAMQKSVYALLAAKERQQLTEQAGVEALHGYWLARTELERALGASLAAGSDSSAAGVVNHPAESPQHGHH